ncbi:ACP phosphodiesterase [Alcanivorax sp.]|uniref:acyl carrier protein phosphodiesterase n=1 Tax=Alcanivorax sp. TaxID=1872427 RepID=UPI0025C14B79|nr:ACP phosphodiesterase [Alcanivorax sp.]
MNYFAHLSLAQPTAASKVGNLLGDFMRGVDEALLPLPVRLGLRNHRLVDRFTDMHPRVRESRRLFSPQRRRFAGVALDVLFDHFLIRHWSRFYTESLESVISRDYVLLRQGEIFMPESMRRTTERLVAFDVFHRYQELDQLGDVLDRIAGRIRFANQFEGSIEDIREHYGELEQVFLAVYPQLRRVVRGASVERGR